ncbi:hypothetical protein FJZ26_01755, partial [Candidatus Parvarchaeota archaeon]|nr:hypothetical protein [Candidatus Parvarchaeota archaeon]
MKKNGNMGIIILAAVFASFLMFGCTQSGPEQKANQTAALDTAQAKLVLGSFEKAAALDDYTLEYVEDAQGKVSEVTLRVKGSERQATIKSALDEKNFYFGYGRMIGCVRIKDGEQTCAQVAEGSRAIDAAKAADRIFFSEKQASDDYNLNKFLIGKGAINFTGAIVPSRQAGADCSAVEYTTNYKILSINDLAYIGFAADNPTVSVFSGYRTKVCIGAQDGVPLLLNLTYNYKDVPQYYSRVALKFEKNTGRAVVTPQNLANQTEFEKKYAEAQALLDSYGKCKKLENATERDSCYAAAAFESYAPSICEKVEGVIKHDQCLIALVGHANQPGLCAKTTVLKD